MKYFELFQKYAWLLVIILIVFIIIWTSSNTSKYDAIMEQNNEQIDILQEQNKLLQDRIIQSNNENSALYSRIDSLSASISTIRLQTAVVRQEANKEVEESRDFSTEQIGESIERRINSPVAVSFSSVNLPTSSAQVVLERLILSEATQKELSLSNERIAKLEEQIALQNGIIENKDKIIETQNLQLQNQGLELQATLNAKNAEIAKIKASNRKRNLIFTALGYVGGIITGIRIL